MTDLTTQDARGGAPGGPSPVEMHPADIADRLSVCSLAEALAGLKSLPLERRAAAFAYLAPHTQIALASAMARAQLANIVAAMGADDRVDLFRRIPPERQNALLQSLARAHREEIRRLAGYAEGTAGAIMTSDYATLQPTLDAHAALEKLRQEAQHKETIYHTYVVDDRGRLIGIVDLQKLIAAAPDTPIASLMARNTHAVQVDEHQREVARRVAKYDLLALPVVDAGHRLLGIVTHDDALDVLEDEATRDYHRTAVVGPILENVGHVSVALLYRTRVVWLIVLVLGNLLSSAGFAYFEDTIAAYVALVFFLPLLGAGGNSGTQASTLMIRALATGDVVLKDLGRLLGREVLVSSALGLSMAAMVGGIALLRGGQEIALVVAITMLVVVIIVSLLGTAVPFIVTRLGADPGTASAPLIATCADAIAVIFYFALASMLLGIPDG